MLEKIAQVVTHYEEVERQLSDPLVLADHVKLTELAQERAEMQPLVAAYRRYQQVEVELQEAQEFAEREEEAEMIALAKEEIDELIAEQETLEKKMRSLLVPKDRRDSKNVFVEIRAGAGGDEGGIFAADLTRMYIRYAEGRGWSTQIIEESRTGVGGYNKVVLMVKGRGAYSRFKFESGVHRVQRVPATESQGRIHTSTATVAVMPEIDDVEITLDDRDLEITAEFSSGPGGQHMQKNATAARIVHKPSGLMVKIQTERSLSQNKQLGKAIIQARLQEQEEAKQNAAVAADRKEQVGSGDRSEKIRTYNYPQGRVTDHRIGYSNYNLPAVIDGDIDPFIDALTVADEAAKLAAIENQ
ncbi:MAG: peptide chain release factor 1 [Anaerolineales bacterium]|nr:peptide chain release factor 1 [Anaerolineales bacterium]